MSKENYQMRYKLPSKGQLFATLHAARPHQGHLTKYISDFSNVSSKLLASLGI